MSKQRKSHPQRAARRSLRTLTAAAAVTPLALLGVPAAVHAIAALPVDGEIESRLQDQLGGDNLKVGESITVDLEDIFAEADSYLVYVQNASVADVTTLSGELYIGAKKEGTTLVSVTAFDDAHHLVGDERFRLTVEANPALDADGNGYDIQDAAKAVRAMTGLSDAAKKEATRTALRSAESFLDLPNRGPLAGHEAVEIEIPEHSTHVVYLDEYFSDPDGDLLEYAAVGGLPSASTVGGFSLNEATGTLHIDAYSYNSGSTTVTIRATDAEALSVTREFRFRLADSGQPPLNQIPVAEPDTYAIHEDSQLAGNVLANDIDPDGDSLAAVRVSDPAHGWLLLEPTGDFTYAPDPDYYGTDTFSYKAYDGTDYSAVATVTVEVSPVNDLPFKTPNATFATTVMHNDFRVITADQLAYSDVDNEPESLTYTITDFPDYGSLKFDDAVVSGEFSFTQEQVNDGRLSYAHSGGQATSDSFSFRVTDGEGTTEEAEFTITIKAANNPVAATNLLYDLMDNDWMARPGQSIVVDLEALFVDPDNDPLTYSVSTEYDGFIVTSNGNVVTLLADENSADGYTSFIISADDGFGGEITESFSLEVGGGPSMTDETIALGDSHFYAYVGDYFSIPSSQYVEYSVESSDASVANIMLEGEYLSISGLLAGTTTVTVTGTGSNGLQLVDSFDLEVSPIVVTDAGPVMLSEDGNYFGDFDLNDMFAHAVDYRFYLPSSGFAITSQNGATVPAGTWRSEMSAGLQSEHAFRIVADNPDNTITIEARDAAGRIVPYELYTMSDDSSEYNASPEYTGTAPETVYVKKGGTFTLQTLEPAPLFVDPDGDPLDYAVSIIDIGPNVASAGALDGNGSVVISGSATGEAIILVSATDPYGEYATVTIQLQVVDEIIDWANQQSVDTITTAQIIALAGLSGNFSVTVDNVQEIEANEVLTVELMNDTYTIAGLNGGSQLVRFLVGNGVDAPVAVYVLYDNVPFI